MKFNISRLAANHSSAGAAISPQSPVWNLGKYSSQYLAAFHWRFNRRFHLQRMVSDLTTNGAASAQQRERAIWALAGVQD